MSFESTEDRIKRLEESVALLSRMNESLTAELRTSSKLHINALLELREQQNAIMRFIASQPAFGDANQRKKFLTQLAIYETALDQLTAQARDLNQKQ
ncbi:MAG: hypothetical protein WDM80_13615 [Limisphaerales bacterium]